MCYIRPVYTTCAGWADKKILPRVLSRRPHSYGSEDGHFSSPLGHLATQKHWHSTFNSLLEYMNLSKRTAHLSYGHLTEKTSSWSFCDVHVLQKEDEKTNDVNAILANKCTFGGKMTSKLLWTRHCEAVKGTREISAGNCAATNKGRWIFAGNCAIARMHGTTVGGFASVIG